MSDTLFDPNAFGPGKTVRTRKRRVPDTIRLQRPWVVLGRPGRKPEAHLLAPSGSRTKEGSVRTRCAVYGYVIPTEGHPTVAVCPHCYGINRS